ncbi:MAG: hypothetical protein C4B59_16430 [Candidatus Methanogaster sp.]|uniref:Uncharacterized protein n=1 Tax=Candidatus Methanogaster sp. TaxID=3386292 RepID=A0AC61KYD1_9EURY|nr:MAG: hypothetical protein C4B59_16430 [ANME-2 cluster archaeon]
MRWGARGAGIGCIVDEFGLTGLLFGPRVCCQWLEYPEKLELWHGAVSSWQLYQTECLIYYVDDMINSGYKEVDALSKQLP